MSDKLIRFAGILLAVQTEFEEKLSTKTFPFSGTGWGRDEILATYRDAVNAVLARYVDAKNP